MSDDKHCSAPKTFLDHCSDLRIRPGTTQISIIALMRQRYRAVLTQSQRTMSLQFVLVIDPRTM